MPIVDIQRHGDFTTAGSFRRDDIKIISSEKAQHKLLRLVSRTPPMAIHFINLPKPFNNVTNELFWTSKVGLVTPTSIGINFDLEIHAEPAALSVVLVENEGKDRISLTPWMVAHRISHALTIGICSSKLLKVAYDNFFSIAGSISKSFVTEANKKHTMMVWDMPSCFGTSKAARSGKIDSRFSEWFHECFSQYCFTGRVRFRTAEDHYSRRGVTFKLNRFESTRDIDVRWMLIGMTLQEAFQNTIKELAGKIVLL